MKSNEKNVMLILSRMPYPPTSGDTLKSYNLIKILSKNFKVSLVVLAEEKPSKAQLDFCNQYCSKIKIFIKHKFYSYLNATKSLFNGKPLQVNYYYFKDVQKYINNETNNNDIIINTLIRTSEYVINLNKSKYLDMVDSIAMNYQRSKDKVNSIFWKLIYNFELNRLLDYERKCVKLYNNTFLVNRTEAEELSKFGKTTWIPNGVNESLFNYRKTDKSFNNSLAFFGRMDYQPNIDAVLWFIENILPKLNSKINFIIVGSHPANSIKALANDRIKVTGFLEDPFIILNSCFAIVAPMQTGGGIQNKILESMALGKIVLTNSLGSNPIIGANNYKHLISEDDKDSYIYSINKVFENYSEYEKIGDNAKQFIKNNYTWQSYENKLLAMLEGYKND